MFFHPINFHPFTFILYLASFSKRSTQIFHSFPIVLCHIPSFFPLFFSSFSPPLQSPQVQLGGRTRGESMPHRHPIATWYITLKKFTSVHLFYHLISSFLSVSGRSAPRPPKLTLFAKITSPSLAASFYPLPILSTVFIAFPFFSILLCQSPSFFPLFFSSYVIYASICPDPPRRFHACFTR